MADQEHVRRLLEGGEGWTQWREENPDIRPNFSGAKFSGVDLSGVDLSGVDLSGADLRGADLRGADLRGVDLSGADLSGAKLSGVDLYWADLSGAKLSSVDLSSVDLSGAKLSGAKLSGAKLSGAKLSGVDLSSVDLSGAKLSDADLSDADLSSVDLYWSDLSGAKLSGVDLRGADLRGADLRGADLRGADLRGADLRGADLRGADLRGADLRGADLRGVDLHDAKLYGASLYVADLRRASLYGVDLRGVDLIEANFSGIVTPRSSQKVETSSRVVPSISSDYSLSEPDLEDIAEFSLGIDEEPKQFLAFCYVHAEMDERVVVNRPTSVEVVVSKELLDRSTSNASQGGTVELESEQELIVQVISKTNFVSEGDDRLEVDPPQEGKPQTLYFDLRATHLGEGEVWVVLRQTQQALLTLVLRPQIVENRAALRTMAAARQLLAAPSSTENPVDSSSQRLRVSDSVTVLPTPSAPLHQLRIIERRNGSQITYLYELNSPLLGVLSLHESKPINSDRFEYVENLYKEIESRWASTQGDKDDFAAELRAFGGQLFDQLFPDALKQQLWQYREQLDNIMVLSTEPFIPWELVHLKPLGQNYLPSETYFLGQMGLVRWLHDVGFPPETLRLRLGGYARYVIPQYPDPRYRLPQAEQEAHWLEEYFEATPIMAQPSQVREELRSSNFDLLHFAGHGLAEQDIIAHAKLMLEGRMENGRYVQAHLSATTVEQYCDCNQRDRNERPMVVLNACQIGREGYCLTGISGFAQAFLKGGVGAFVGTLWSVGDRSARLFTETLYASLLEGKTLSESTTVARQASQQAGDSTWLAYVVYGHPHLKLRTVDDGVE